MCDRGHAASRCARCCATCAWIDRPLSFHKQWGVSGNNKGECESSGSVVQMGLESKLKRHKGRSKRLDVSGARTHTTVPAFLLHPTLSSLCVFESVCYVCQSTPYFYFYSHTHSSQLIFFFLSFFLFFFFPFSSLFRSFFALQPPPSPLPLSSIIPVTNRLSFLLHFHFSCLHFRIHSHRTRHKHTLSTHLHSPTLFHSYPSIHIPLAVLGFNSIASFPPIQSIPHLKVPPWGCIFSHLAQQHQPLDSTPYSSTSTSTSKFADNWPSLALPTNSFIHIHI